MPSAARKIVSSSSHRAMPFFACTGHTKRAKIPFCSLPSAPYSIQSRSSNSATGWKRTNTRCSATKDLKSPSRRLPKSKRNSGFTTSNSSLPKSEFQQHEKTQRRPSNSPSISAFLAQAGAGCSSPDAASSCPPRFLSLSVPLYVRFGSLPPVAAALYGLKPVIIAVVLHAIWKLAKTAIKSRVLAALIVAIVVAALLGTNPLPLLFAAGALTGTLAWFGKKANRPPIRVLTTLLGVCAAHGDRPHRL